MSLFFSKAGDNIPVGKVPFLCQDKELPSFLLQVMQAVASGALLRAPPSGLPESIFSEVSLTPSINPCDFHRSYMGYGYNHPLFRNKRKIASKNQSWDLSSRLVDSEPSLLWKGE